MLRAVFEFPAQPVERDSSEFRHVAARDEAHARHSRNLRFGRQLGRYGRVAWNGTATVDQQQSGGCKKYFTNVQLAHHCGPKRKVQPQITTPLLGI